MAKGEIRFEHIGNPARLDRTVAERAGEEWGITRSQAERMIEEGRVSVNGRAVLKPAFKVAPGSWIEVQPPRDSKSTLAPLELRLDVLYEDDHLLVINKPAGLSMHPGAGNASHTLANAVIAHVGKGQLAVGSADRPGIVHRLDKDTTGVVVVAKSAAVLASLSKQFAERSIGRCYRALVFTTPRARRQVQLSDNGTVSAPIGRHPRNRKMMCISEQGRAAITDWRVLERFAHGTLVECSLRTGRTHQIRVHMEHIGSPVIGDRTYGDFSNLPAELRQASEMLGRQALHAAALAFTHPVSGKRLSFEAPLPLDFRMVLDLFRQKVG